MSKPPDEHLDDLEQRFHAGELPAAAPPEDELEALRGTFLWKRLAKRRGYGVGIPDRRPRQLFGLPALLILAALAAWSFWGTLPGLRYWLSSAPPIDIGHLGGYHPERAPDGSFVAVEGWAPQVRGSYSRMLRDHEVFPLIASRIAVDRPSAPDPSLKGYGFFYKGSGRLLRASADSRWEALRSAFVEAGELPAEGELYVLLDGDAPRRGWRIPAEAAAWALLGAVCLAVAARRMRSS